MSLVALAVSLVGAVLPLHATVRGGDITSVEVRGQTVAFASLSRTKLEPVPATVTATAPGATTAIEIPHCGRRGTVTIDGTRYAPPPGPFVVRVAPRAEPHAIAIEITVSEYEKRVACSDPIRAGIGTV